MKIKLTYLVFFLMLISFNSEAQDIALPKGKSTIYLKSGKIIKDVKIWKTDTLKIEYVKNGNLADIKTNEVSKIIFSDGSIRKFNKTYQSDNYLTNNQNTLYKQDSMIYFRRFHVSFGLGGNIWSAKNLFEQSFVGTSYKRINSVINLFGNTNNETPEIYINERFFINVECNYNSKLRFGVAYYPYSAGFVGCKRVNGVANHNLIERIEGNRFSFNGFYTFLKCKKACGINLSVGVSLISNSTKIVTEILFLNNSNSYSYYNSATVVDTIGIKEKKQSVGIEFSGRFDLNLRKSFSFFLKPYILFDSGINIDPKSIYSHNQTALIPSQQINFSGFGLIGGIAFHFVKGKTYN